MNDDYMCPNCVTPWKCNGPHIDEAPDFTFLRRLLEQQRATWEERHG